MTRNNNSKRSYSPARSTITDSSNDDSVINLPDLSGLKEDEKQHILNVLLRDESLRNKHLARFMQLRKEVADLEQHSQSTSTSVCARCQTPFGFIFNTGDSCPKCGAKVCKQCRLMYNVNDNGWLCQLCCKQMQLMSYSGEWIYSFRSNLRKDSVTASEIVRQSLSPSASIPNLTGASSSDTETENTIDSSNRVRPSFQRTKSNQQNQIDNMNRMVVQTSTDEQKLDFLKQNVQKRPLYMQTRDFTTDSHVLTGASSDDVDSLFDRTSNRTARTSSSSMQMATNDKYQRRSSPVPTTTDSISTVQNETDRLDNNDRKSRIDCASVTSSEWGVESEKSERTSHSQGHKISKKHGSKRSLSSRGHLAGSMQSLRNAVHRIPKPRRSSSRTTVNSEQNSKAEIPDTTSMKTTDKQSKSESNTKLSAKDDSNSIVSNGAVQRKQVPDDSIQTTNNNNNKRQTKSDAFGSVGNLDAIDSDDDIDGTFEKAKMGSQISINSVLSETKARYGLDISGTIEIKLTYTLATGALDIFINKCTGLTPAKRNQTSDPFVKVYLLPDRSKNSKRKSTMKKNTIDPIFEEKFRYHVTKQEFETRVIWISVWSQASFGQNDFLGEIHIPLANCTLDSTHEYPLLAQKKKNELSPSIVPTMDPAEILFQLAFIENPKNKEIGTLQVHYVEAKAIYYGKHQVDAICKGLLMPDKVKRKMPTIRKGPSPKWEVPLRWDGIRRDNLKNTSIELSIWCQERFRKFMYGFVRLNLAKGHFDNKPVTWLDSTKAEKAVWETFINDLSRVHRFKLPLRPATIENK